MTRHLFRSLCCLLLLASVAFGQGVLIVSPNPQLSWTPEQIHQPPGWSGTACPSGVVVADLLTLAQGKINAAKMQWALQNQDALDKVLIMPAGKTYAVADNETVNNGDDIYVSGVMGLTWLSAGGPSDRLCTGDLYPKYSHAESCLIHVGDVGPTGDTVVHLNNCRSARFDLSIRGANVTLAADAITAMNFADPANHSVSPCALLITDDDTGAATSGKGFIDLAATLCNRAIDIYGSPDTWGPDQMQFPACNFRYCHYGVRVQGLQSVGFYFDNLKTSGSQMVRCLEFLQSGSTSEAKAGGICKVNDWYLSPGVMLYTDSATSLARFDCHVRGDANVVNNSTFILQESGTVNPGSALDCRWTGSFSEPADHQIIIDHDQSGAHDIECDIGPYGLGDAATAYPRRPMRLQWIPRPLEPTLLSSTVLAFDAERATLHAVPIGWTADASTLAITTALDASASANQLVVGGTSPTLARSFSHSHDGVLFGGSGRLIDATPTGVGAAIDDWTWDGTFRFDNIGANNQVIYWNRNTDNTGGVEIYKNSTNHLVVQCGTDTLTQTDTVQQFRTYRLFVKRTKATGTYIAKLDGTDITSSLTGHSQSQFAAVNGPVIIGQASASGPVYNNGFIGVISQVFVDNAAISASGSPSDTDTRNAYVRQYIGY